MDKINFETYRPGKIVCVGMNYKGHVREQDGRFPKKPVLFCKATTSLIKNKEDIICPPEVSELDYEVELAAVIGKRAKDISVENIKDYIYGYTIMNDITARDIQKAEGQWFRAKSFDTFAPIGPDIIRAEHIKNPDDLNLRSYVNGELRQNSNTSDMIFGVYELVSFISKFMTLEEGDLVSTGTPAGVGVFMTRKTLLQDGDIITCHIEKIGDLANRVIKR
jgi:2-keto-4-pentenoate hydratase/2-oxohepta-3-ene-1,7-dioic acid hydratase in catechol pathway